MTKEDTELLLKDISARIPYGIKVQQSGVFEKPGFLYYSDDRATREYNIIGIRGRILITDKVRTEHTYAKGYVSHPIEHNIVNWQGRICKPYLRPLSSMTQEECEELSKLKPIYDDVESWKYIKTPVPLYIANIEQFDFFNSHHLDWRGLIPKGLALEAPKDMYKI